MKIFFFLFLEGCSGVRGDGFARCRRLGGFLGGELTSYRLYLSGEDVAVETPINRNSVAVELGIWRLPFEVTYWRDLPGYLLWCLIVLPQHDHAEQRQSAVGGYGAIREGIYQRHIETCQSRKHSQRTWIPITTTIITLRNRLTNGSLYLTISARVIRNIGSNPSLGDQPLVASARLIRRTHFGMGAILPQWLDSQS